MNDELKQRLTKYLDYLEDAARHGADFASEQVPETVRQLIAFNLWNSIVHAGISLAFIFTFILIACLVRRKFLAVFPGNNDVQLATLILCPILTLLVSLIPILEALAHTTIAMKCWLAPNVFVLETIERLLK